MPQESLVGGDLLSRHHTAVPRIDPRISLGYISDAGSHMSDYSDTTQYTESNFAAGSQCSSDTPEMPWGHMLIRQTKSNRQKSSFLHFWQQPLWVYQD